MAKYRVSYLLINYKGEWIKHVTVVTYKTKAKAQKYANQLNRGLSTKYARVRKA